MASSLPSQLDPLTLRLWLLRATYYNTALPRHITASYGSFVASELEALKVSGLIERRGERYKLTDYGRLEIRKLSNGELPPMIEERGDALRAPRLKLVLRIGGSQARKLAKEFSTGR